MKLAEIRKWAKANEIIIPFGSKSHEVARVIRESGVEAPAEVTEALDKIIADAAAKDKAEWTAANDGQGEDAPTPVEASGAASAPSPAPIPPEPPNAAPAAPQTPYEDVLHVVPAPPAPVDEAFRTVFNAMEAGRGYTLAELTAIAGFEVTEAHFEEPMRRDIAFPKSGGRWVRRPRNYGENNL